MSTHRSGDDFEVLSEEECLRLLRTREVGRLGIIAGGGQPVVLPVNYSVVDDVVVLRTAPGTKLSASPLAKVAFEVDDIDKGTHSGWSVLVQGVAHDVTDAIDPASERQRALAPQPWAPGAKTHVVHVVPEHITGRRFGGQEGW